MRPAFEALVIALLAVAVLTPVVRVMAVRLGAVAHPGGRHVHQTVIPRLGDTRDGGEKVAQRWSASEGGAREWVTAMYPLGRDGVARASIRFGCSTISGTCRRSRRSCSRWRPTC